MPNSLVRSLSLPHHRPIPRGGEGNRDLVDFPIRLGPKRAYEKIAKIHIVLEGCADWPIIGASTEGNTPMKEDTSHYVVQISKGGETLALTFDNEEIARQLRSYLRLMGYDVVISPPYVTNQTLHSALAVVEDFFH